MVEGSHKRNQIFGTFRCLSRTFFLERRTNSHKHDSHVTLNQQTYRCHLPVTCKEGTWPRVHTKLGVRKHVSCSMNNYFEMQCNLKDTEKVGL